MIRFWRSPEVSRSDSGEEVKGLDKPDDDEKIDTKNILDLTEQHSYCKYLIIYISIPRLHFSFSSVCCCYHSGGHTALSMLPSDRGRSRPRI